MGRLRGGRAVMLAPNPSRRLPPQAGSLLGEQGCGWGMKKGYYWPPHVQKQFGHERDHPWAKVNENERPVWHSGQVSVSTAVRILERNSADEWVFAVMLSPPSDWVRA
jgi:hypothetical protein